MLDEIFAFLIVLVTLGIGFVVQPHRARCDAGEFVMGVRASGATWCTRDDAPDVDCSGTKRCHNDAPLFYTTPLKIYCTSGQTAIVVDERTIGCQARH